MFTLNRSFGKLIVKRWALGKLTCGKLTRMESHEDLRIGGDEPGAQRGSRTCPRSHGVSGGRTRSRDKHASVRGSEPALPHARPPRPRAVPAQGPPALPWGSRARWPEFEKSESLLPPSLRPPPHGPALARRLPLVPPARRPASCAWRHRHRRAASRPGPRHSPFGPRSGHGTRSGFSLLGFASYSPDALDTLKKKKNPAHAFPPHTWPPPLRDRAGLGRRVPLVF